MFGETFWCIAVALLWGCTNPLMKRGASGVEKVSSESPLDKQKGLILKTLLELQYLVFNWRYTLPFLINQGGSVLYYWTLSTATLSVAVPLTNACTLVITVLVGKLLGEKSEGPVLYIGVVLVFVGIAITSY